VHVRGRVTVHKDLDELLRFATAIGARYMGENRGEEFGRRNAVPGGRGQFALSSDPNRYRAAIRASR